MPRATHRGTPGTPAGDRQAFDEVYDVVIAGYGYAGGMAAIAAADAGASVGLFEKCDRPGGNSIISGGSCVFGTDYESTLDYLRHTCGGATDDDVLQAFAIGMVNLPSLISSLAEPLGFRVLDEDRGEAAYPFEGADQLRSLRITRNETFDGFAYVSGGRAGTTLFHVVEESVRKRHNIDVHVSARALRLIQDDYGVAGLVVQTGDQTKRIAAKRAVILCTGGFEHNERLFKNFLGTGDYISASPLGNTGDGILIGQQVGAALWHMWHVHGSYGFRVPGLALGVRHSFVGKRRADRPMPWIVVDGDGRRFFNEYPPAPQDTPIRELTVFDANRQTFPRIPSFLVFDEAGRNMGPIGRPVASDPSLSYEWSADNSREVDSGIIARADSIEALAVTLGIDAACLRGTVDRWNQGCVARRDDDFRRPGWSMRPLDTSPFYAAPVYPIVTNTQGGLVHDAEQRVINSFGEVIPRLYKAGEIGSIFGHLYLLGGNNTECFIGGSVAGRNAAAEPDRFADDT
jgi:succinate dehydrogenase/fumarate reductase flavoprotein subunit